MELWLLTSILDDIILSSHDVPKIGFKAALSQCGKALQPLHAKTCVMTHIIHISHPEPSHTSPRPNHLSTAWLVANGIS